MKESTEKMIDMLAESLEIALGDEWLSMTDEQKHAAIMELAQITLKAMK